ncbi:MULTISPECIES: phosphatase PAP2 family protein [unclassified Aureimonas]|uniref:phosphatase PAP2 family protein n=1 Tax=unclassified Aureimonas TaxID=2615206 RepID=UPI0006F2BAA5|nr:MULTISPECIES: phosphatase PAP2 family protein [unclassified Aureimonas]KQT64450.1 hypothetical protein ASG62_05710 [Aureimonas sp. Leaf427]KQT81638.1 hypothetical protein ASG54_02990 [Aureimonas sp. Leaf460]
MEAALHSALPIAAILAVQFGTYSLVSFFYPSRVLPVGVSSDMVAFVAVCLMLGVLFTGLCRMLRFTRPKSPVRELAAQMSAILFDAHRLLNGVLTLALLVPFMAMFAAIKVSLPMIAPFAWDATLTDWDRALFFGWLPYEVLQPILRYPAVILALDWAYKLWFLLLWIALLGFGFTRSVPVLRTRFLVSFFLAWFLLGNGLAVLLSSAGPCFYGLLDLGPDPYQPLMAHLREVDRAVPISALQIQALLWSGYLGTSDALGISAAPSLHNAMSLLMALAAWAVDRRLGLALYAFAAVTFLASIGLGWHYAVDGLIAFAATAAIWNLAGRFANSWEGRDHDPHPRAGRTTEPGDLARSQFRQGLA